MKRRKKKSPIKNKRAALRQLEKFKVYLTREVAAATGLNRQTIMRHVAKGKLRKIPVPTQEARFLGRDVIRYIRAN